MASVGGLFGMSASAARGIRAGLQTAALIILLTAVIPNTTAHAVFGEGSCLWLPCPETPLCTSVAVEPSSIDRLRDCYCAVPKEGNLKHWRLIPALRRAKFVGVVRGTDADADDYKEKPVSGGGTKTGLTGPIIDVPVSLRSASLVELSDEGRTLKLTLASGAVLSFTRDPKTGDLQY